MPKETARYHHGDLREALVEASIAILKEEGIAGLTLRSAARHVGVSHAAPKNHFGDLQGLLAAVAASGFRKLSDALERAKASRQGSVDQLLAIGQAYVRFALASPGHFRAVFHPLLGDRNLSAELEEASGRAFGVLVTTVAEAQAAGEVREGDVVELSLTAWSLVHGFASLSLDGHLRRKGVVRAPLDLANALAAHLMIGLGNYGGR